jgi:hypothetical protein
MRTRMSGGVGGAEPRGSPLSRFCIYRWQRDRPGYQRSFPLRNRAAGVNPRSAGPKPGAPLTGSDQETGSSAARARDPATLGADVM